MQKINFASQNLDGVLKKFKLFTNWSSSSVHHPEKFPKFLWPWKVQHQIPFKHIFWSIHHLPNFFSNQTYLYASKRVIFEFHQGISLFSFHFLCWDKIKTQEWSEVVVSACSLLKNRLCHLCFPVNFTKII